MKITFITNAACIYEANGFRLLADPWLVPGAFGSWVHDPPLRTRPEDVVDVDALYISHIHPDHCCPETLKHFRRDIPIVTLGGGDDLCGKHLLRMGFTRVATIFDGSSLFRFGPMKLTMFGPFTKHPFHADACEIGNVVDSALLIEHNGVKVLNCNDNTMTPEVAEQFYKDYGAVDLAQLNSNAAGPYPACFRNLSHDEKLSERDRIFKVQTDNMVAVAKALRAKRVQPFAGQYKLGYGLEGLNDYLPMWPQDRIAEYLRARDVNAIVLREGESIDL